MTRRDTDVVVVGVGVMGAATARALAKAGREVVMLEQFEVGHKRGSSHGASRIFRLSYHDAMYVRMARESLPMWRELEEESGSALLTVTGGLDAGKRMNEHVDALTACGVPFEILDVDEAERRFPFLTLPRGEAVLYQADAGFLAADRCVRASVDSAVSVGAALREHMRAHALNTDGDRVEVVTDAETIRAGVAVVTAGSWVRPLAETAGVDVRVVPSRETVAYFAIDPSTPLTTFVDWSDPLIYALPSPEPRGIKAGIHHGGPQADPDEIGSPSEKTVEVLSSWIAERYPGADATPISPETCMYTNTEDEHFILERHGRIVIGSPCSGHGFKFAPWIGRRLAELAATSTERG